MIPTAHPSPQPKRHLDRFSGFRTGDRRVSLYFTMGYPFPPSKLPLPMTGIWTASNAWFPGPTRVLNPNGISLGATVFAGLTGVTDTPTDGQTDRQTMLLAVLGWQQQAASTYAVLRCGLKCNKLHRTRTASIQCCSSIHKSGLVGCHLHLVKFRHQYILTENHLCWCQPMWKHHILQHMRMKMTNLSERSN